MKIVLLSEADNYHTKKWVKALLKYDLNILLISIGNRGEDFYEKLSNVECICLGVDKSVITSRKWYKKLEYLKFVFRIRKEIKLFGPEIVHSHFASSYGLLGALCKADKFIVSVWGSDIYDFPTKSYLHKMVIKFVLSRADRILSTSKCMRDVTYRYTSKDVEITPFGVDVEHFKHEEHKDKDELIIGTVKALYPKYGIENLLRAFKLVKDNSTLNVKLVIAGEGEYREEYQLLADGLGLSDSVNFLGYIDNSKVPTLLNEFDVFVALSQLDSESFGVSAVEAMSCSIPVVVSDVDGFKEVVPQGAGYIVDRNDIKAASDAIVSLLSDKEKRVSFGQAGRCHVVDNYDFSSNVRTMYDIYCRLSLKS